MEPVLAAAFEDAGIRRRTPALPFVATYELPAELAVEESQAAPEHSAEQAAEKVVVGISAEQKAEQAQHVKKAKRRPRVSAAAEQTKPAAEVEDRWTGIVCTGDGC